MSIFDIEDLRNRTHVFRDRVHGGEVLASFLRRQREDSDVVLAIPSGGVPVAIAVCEKLDLPLDLMIVSKITLPWNSEAGYGAVASDGTYKLNDELLGYLGLTPNEVQKGIEETKEKVSRRISHLRSLRPQQEISGKNVILIDDGLASGFTMQLAVEAALQSNAQWVVVAVPTGHEDSVRKLGILANAVYCGNLRYGQIFAVADAYEEWHDLTEEEVIDLLSKAVIRF
ncbi:phosphoribosyltransferase [bacterium]|nr:phosphoribosyltransferase [bacterium]MCI0605638.1 phosphoribosyltransferase [bacterium]